MATPAMSVQFPATPPIACHKPSSPSIHKTTRVGKVFSKPSTTRNRLCWVRAIEKRRESPETSSEAPKDPSEPVSEAESTQLGSEIKAAMEEKKKSASEEEGFLAGVSSEVKRIEWPAFGKVIGITGVVLGVIAGSSVVLLTLNFVLAELSDQLFAGKGVQDFFS